MINATETVAASHETLAQKIDEDVEHSLREYGTKNRDLASMPVVQNDLASLAKNLEGAQKKVDKAKEKGPKGADKLASAVHNAEEVNQQWESRAPFVFEQLQAVDEGRLNHLRDVLTQLGTHETDHVERCREAAESCLNALLNVETADEIKTFAAKANGGRPVQVRRPETSPSAPPSAPAAPSAATATTTAAPAAAPSLVQDDVASQNSEAPTTTGRGAPPPVPEPRHPLGGLKRLGTVMSSRRKSIAQPSGGSIFSDKKGRSPFSTFKRGDSRDMQIPESPSSGQDRPNTGLTTQESVAESARQPSESRDREGLSVVSPIIQEPQSTAPAAAAGATNGRPDQEPQAAPSVGITSTAPNESRVDSEGFSERPQAVDEITRTQREAVGLDEHGMNLTIREQPIFEDESQAKQAMDDMANTLRMRAPQPGIRRNAGTIRGRRDVRNTVFVPNAQPMGHESSLALGGAGVAGVAGGAGVAGAALSASPSLSARHATSPSNATDDHTISDTTSIRSSTTVQTAPAPLVHQDLHGPGLNASVIETVNAWFSEGAVTKSFVIGELALAYNSAPGASFDNMRVRLNNFHVLEKVAANPHFVTENKGAELTEEKRGEYNVALPSISRASPTVAFKYQIHLDQPNSSAYCPIIFKPAWNIEEFQASVIVFYYVNPAFTSSVPVESIVVKNLVLTVNLDISPAESREVAHATNAVMHPNQGATFRRKHSAVTWKLPELEVKAGGDGKFLVRFTTSSSWPRQGKVEAKFETHSTDGSSRLGISAASESTGKAADPFADDGSPTPSAGSQSPQTTWDEVPTARKLVTGKYVSS